MLLHYQEMHTDDEDLLRLKESELEGFAASKDTRKKVWSVVHVTDDSFI